MTKNQTTILFLVLGTLANIVITIVLILVLTLLAGLLLKDNAGPVLPFIFVLAVIGGIFIYQKIMKKVMNKYKLEEKMNPGFGQKKDIRK